MCVEYRVGGEFSSKNGSMRYYVHDHRRCMCRKRRLLCCFGCINTPAHLYYYYDVFCSPGIHRCSLGSVLTLLLAPQSWSSIPQGTTRHSRDVPNQHFETLSLYQHTQTYTLTFVTGKRKCKHYYYYDVQHIQIYLLIFCLSVSMQY